MSKKRKAKPEKSIDWKALGLENLSDNGKLKILQKEIQKLKMVSDDIVGLDGYTDAQRQEKLRKLIKRERITKKHFREMRESGEFDKEELRQLGIINLGDTTESLRYQTEKYSIINAGLPTKQSIDALINSQKTSKALIDSLQAERGQDEKFNFQRTEVKFLVNWFIRKLKAQLEQEMDKVLAEEIIGKCIESTDGWEQRVPIEMKRIDNKDNEDIHKYKPE